ncbi:MAG: helix-turn-helix transcriptional regulator [Rhodospirillales bacterium]|nr:helix-turn-helix transcriptional regulator [Rhodospirillales bacterium]
MQHDLLHIQGKPYMLVPLHEYRSMTTLPGAENDNAALPDALLDLIHAGNESPVKLIRKHRGLTQAELAEAAGLSRPYLTEIERGRKDGSVNAIKALADALEVPVGLLI